MAVKTRTVKMLNNEQQSMGMYLSTKHTTQAINLATQIFC